MRVDPAPENGSSTTRSLEAVKQRIKRWTKVTGNSAGCFNAISSGDFLMSDQMDIEYLVHVTPSSSFARLAWDRRGRGGASSSRPKLRVAGVWVLGCTDVSRLLGSHPFLRDTGAAARVPTQPGWRTHGRFLPCV